MVLTDWRVASVGPDSNETGKDMVTLRILDVDTDLVGQLQL